MRRKLLKADIARGLGVSRSRVAQLEAQGMPVHSLDAAKAWRAEHCDPDRVKPAPAAAAAAAADLLNPTILELKYRLLQAEVLLREERARNAGGVTLPSLRVEQGIVDGFQLLRASINNTTGAVYADLKGTLGENATRELLHRMEDWWSGVHQEAVDAILLGLQRQLPAWGRAFHHKYRRVYVRGNDPDTPVEGEPRSIDDVPSLKPGDA